MAWERKIMRTVRVRNENKAGILGEPAGSDRRHERQRRYD